MQTEPLREQSMIHDRYSGTIICEGSKSAFWKSAQRSRIYRMEQSDVKEPYYRGDKILATVSVISNTTILDVSTTRSQGGPPPTFRMRVALSSIC